jgi:uncharacterized protein YfaS (alpha-2-macroglobulin family)
MSKAGLDRLISMQLSDGGWGWFSGYGETSTPHLTSVVVHGLHLAREADLAVPDDVLRAGVDWLSAFQAKEIQQLKNARTKTEPWKSRGGPGDYLPITNNYRIIHFLGDRDCGVYAHDC